MFKVPEKYRVTTGNYKSSSGDGNKGLFIVPGQTKKFLHNQAFFQIIASNGAGWEHISVVPIYKSGKQIGRTPTWEEMDYAKNLFWNNEDKPDIVIQLHVPGVFKIDFQPNCLHLWKKIGSIYELPPKNLI